MAVTYKNLPNRMPNYALCRPITNKDIGKKFVEPDGKGGKKYDNKRAIIPEGAAQEAAIMNVKAHDDGTVTIGWWGQEKTMTANEAMDFAGKIMDASIGAMNKNLDRLGFPPADGRPAPRR